MTDPGCLRIREVDHLPERCVGAFEENAPPWRNKELWHAAGSGIAYLIGRYHHHLQYVKSIVSAINILLTSIDPVLDLLCRRTCSFCQSPCCLNADVSYDFRDFLFIQLTGQNLPPGQPRSKEGEICRYLGPAGCQISRFRRPWICTWYICAVQKQCINDHPEFDGSQLQSAISQIGMLRKQMEVSFIDIIS